MFVSTNGGDSWEDRTGNLPDRYPMDIALDPTNEATAYVVFSGFGSGHIFKTSDYGLSWIDASNGLPDVPTNAVVVDPLYPNHIYVGNDLGVFVSVNGGESWETYQSGLNTATMVFDLTISPSNRKLRAATHGNGAYQRDLLEEVVSTDGIAAIVVGLELYPNPARTNTVVAVELTEPQSLGIKLLDANGRTVAQQKTEHYVAGSHQIPFRWSDIPAGTYYVQLFGHQIFGTQKLLIVD
jgi:photosystem II stability/assembly factor-like uncharacterized protein